MSCTIGSLFSGIGGLELGLEWAGLGSTAWQVENNGYCRRVLNNHWPSVDRSVTDVKQAGRKNLKPVDLVCGGFPCQPFSTASRGRRVADDLWPEMRRIILELKPRMAIAENVSYHAIRKAALDLSDIGYKVAEIELSASVVGAPHDRRRWFLVAYSDSKGESRFPINGQVACVLDLPPSGWENHPDTLGVDDGVPHRMDRLRALGNSVSPYCAKVIGRILMQTVVPSYMDS